jgi:hypothetical protein
MTRPHISKKEALYILESLKVTADKIREKIRLNAEQIANKPWHDKTTHKTFLKPNTSKCLHYYFYFIDETLGLCYVRVPTWCPFRLQIYFNGHHWLASELDKLNLHHVLLDNAFIEMEDFKDQVTLKQLYDELVKTAIHTVKPDNIATFLGRKLVSQYHGEFDLYLLETFARGEHCIRGFQNKSLKRFLPGKTCAQISRLLKRLRLHGLIKKIAGTYKYYLTNLGKRLIITSLRIKEHIIVPSLSPSFVQ